MNFTLEESHADVRDLAADLFTRVVTPDRVETIEATAERFDSELWAMLAASGLLGVAVPESLGGLGLGVVELALAAEQLGRVVAPVPFVEVALAAGCLAVHGSAAQQSRWLPGLLDGTTVVVVAPSASTRTVLADGNRLSGVAVGVPWAHVADAVLLPVGDQLFLLDPAGVAVVATREETTARQVAVTLHLDGAPGEPVGDNRAASWLRLRTLAAFSAVQAGVTDAALRLTADYTSTREQFGKPLSTFQGVALKAADAYVDTTAIRATALQAAWALDHTDNATTQVLTAAWWAAEAGQHCVHLTQHLHGGLGADVTYPVHRYFLWGKQIELMLGGASALLAELGDCLSSSPPLS